MIHQRDGKPIPEGWGIDADGNPTTDPAAALAGAQLPFGGYKGASIALMIELLAGALVGDLFSFEASEVDPGDGGPPRGGELVIAIDPAKLSAGGDPLRHAEALFARILEQDGARLPSDRRYAARQRTPLEGVTIPRSLYDTIGGPPRGLSRAEGVTFVSSAGRVDYRTGRPTLARWRRFGGAGGGAARGCGRSRGGGRGAPPIRRGTRR